jgi:hypothetical protein
VTSLPVALSPSCLLVCGNGPGRPQRTHDSHKVSDETVEQEHQHSLLRADMCALKGSPLVVPWAFLSNPSRRQLPGVCERHEGGI